MSDVLRVKWTILAENPPQPLLHCSRCNGTSNFRTSDRIRVNANGRWIDAWLIYKCASCDNTWNRPILERRHLRSIDPLVLAELQGNDPKRARRVALDVEDLKRRVGRLEEFDEVVVRKEVQSPSIAPTRQVEILLLCSTLDGVPPRSPACRGVAALSKPGSGHGEKRRAGCRPARVACIAELSAQWNAPDNHRFSPATPIGLRRQPWAVSRRPERSDTSGVDPNVWSGRASQEDFVDLVVSGLASMYPASDWSSLCSRPSWISARVRSH